MSSFDWELKTECDDLDYCNLFLVYELEEDEYHADFTVTVYDRASELRLTVNWDTGSLMGGNTIYFDGEYDEDEAFEWADDSLEYILDNGYERI